MDEERLPEAPLGTRLLVNGLFGLGSLCLVLGSVQADGLRLAMLSVVILGVPSSRLRVRPRPTWFLGMLALGGGSLALFATPMEGGRNPPGVVPGWQAWFLAGGALVLAAVVLADLLATRSAWRGRTRRAYGLAAILLVAVAFLWWSWLPLCGLPPLGLALLRPERDALQPAPAARKGGLEGSGVFLAATGFTFLAIAFGLSSLGEDAFMRHLGTVPIAAALLAWLGVATERQPKARRGRARAA